MQHDYSQSPRDAHSWEDQFVWVVTTAFLSLSSASVGAAIVLLCNQLH